MTAVPPPPSTPPPPPSTPPPPPTTPPPGAAPPVPPAGVPGAPPPPKPGLSTGAKIAIGCGIAAVILVIVVVGLMGLCARAVRHRVNDLGESMEKQEEAQKKVEEVEREHPFTPPADGALDEGRVGTFFAVTDGAYGKMKDWLDDMAKRGEGMDQRQGRAGFGDAVAGLKGLGAARVALAEAFDDHDMSPTEYVWTGFRLMEAYDAQASGSASGVPAQNVEIARKNADKIAELKQEQGKPGKSAVLGLAFTLYPRADAMLPPGADTLIRPPQ